MKTILLLRHAKSSWKCTDLTDHARPLNTRGKRNAQLMGEVIRDASLLPDLILSSTAKRARKTVALFAEAAAYEGEITTTDMLYLAEARTYVSLLRDMKDSYERILMVGHNPGLEDLIYLLTGHKVAMPTASLAHIEAPIAQWSELDTGAECALLSVWRPRELEQ